MKAKRIFLFFQVTFLFLGGCAQVHSGEYATQVDTKKEAALKHSGRGVTTKGGLLISGKEVSDVSSKYFGLIDLTFENRTNDWMRIENIGVDFGDDPKNRNIKIVSGKDIKIWNDAIERKIAIENYNKDLAVGILTAGGAMMMAGSDNEAAKNVGQVAVSLSLGYFAFRMLDEIVENIENANICKEDITATYGEQGETPSCVVLHGALNSMTVDEFNEKYDKLELEKIFPSEHLMAKNFVIPPGLFAKKWVLFNSTNHHDTGYIESLIIKYDLKLGVTEKVKLSLRKDITSEWQEDIYEAHKNGLFDERSKLKSYDECATMCEKSQKKCKKELYKYKGKSIEKCTDERVVCKKLCKGWFKK